MLIIGTSQTIPQVYATEQSTSNWHFNSTDGFGYGDWVYKFDCFTSICGSLKGVGAVGLLATTVFFNYKKACKNRKFKGSYLSFAKRLFTGKEKIPANIASYLAAGLLASNLVIETKSFCHAYKAAKKEEEIENLKKPLKATENDIKFIKTTIKSILKTENNLNDHLAREVSKNKIANLSDEDKKDKTKTNLIETLLGAPAQKIASEFTEQMIGKAEKEFSSTEIEQLFAQTGMPFRATRTKSGRLKLEKYAERKMPKASECASSWQGMVESLLPKQEIQAGIRSVFEAAKSTVGIIEEAGKKVQTVVSKIPNDLSEILQLCKGIFIDNIRSEE